MSKSARAELATLASYHLVAAKTQLLTRSEFGGRGSNTEPQQILRQMTKSEGGLRQLCQVVLDGRAGRDPQELPDGAMPKNKRFLRAERLTAGRLRELAQISDEQSVTHESPEDLFAAAIADFRKHLEELHAAAIVVNEVVDNEGVALVDAKGYDDPEMKRTFTEVSEFVSEWRAARRRATRMRADLDNSGDEE
ncbi:hypothetical protein [Micromonospora sp. 4G55]|uniref:hypothetical protein n=1 Tax=Micromonospora sp. 4G55 TaxID=2806102 RepID=UPI001A3F2E6C|nr:hypothetical protein [Micromonospora sp. 4G55]MBM0255561.1 hypothetical protein [Micromonospora sp. 4G55]